MKQKKGGFLFLLFLSLICVHPVCVPFASRACMIDIDGSQGEGGGQILRSSLALSLITGQAFRLRNIRARRSKPGLQPQHLTSVKAAATVGKAELGGACLGSQDLVFTPGAVHAGDYHFSIGTAGATGLVLQTIALPLALASSPSTVTIEGGTHVKAAPCFHFLDATWKAYLAALGVHLEMHMVRSGFYPRGGGSIRVNIAPVAGSLKPLHVDVTGATPNIHGLSAAAGLPEHVAVRQAERARQRLRRVQKDVSITEESWPGGPGSMIALTLDTAPAPTVFFALGERGKRAEKVADEVADQVLAFLNSGAAVDAHSGDQLVLPLALAAGPSRLHVSEITPHLLTNVEVIHRFLNRHIECEGKEGRAGWVQIGDDPPG